MLQASTYTSEETPKFILIDEIPITVRICISSGDLICGNLLTDIINIVRCYLEDFCDVNSDDSDADCYECNDVELVRWNMVVVPS